MSKKWKIAIGVLLVVVIGGAVLSFGEMTYLSSEGQRGWSLGAAVYGLFGWDAEAYRADFNHHMEQRSYTRLSLDEEGNLEVVPNAGYSFGRGGRHGGFGYARGGGHLFFWLTVLGIGYLLYRRQKRNSTEKNAA